ncbi:hypothetical protein U9M48_041802 [Paspalum notatum var. saurae]|uniref:Uncharacterized protein n=1 Tax=Paspalum notatum var. saurae TaxID=547442 RepID=A0AAQ3UTF1_PASNO
MLADLRTAHQRRCRRSLSRVSIWSSKRLMVAMYGHCILPTVFYMAKPQGWNAVLGLQNTQPLIVY